MPDPKEAGMDKQANQPEPKMREYIPYKGMVFLCRATLTRHATVNSSGCQTTVIRRN